MKPNKIFVAFFNKSGYVSEEPAPFALRSDKVCWIGSTGPIGHVVRLGLITDPEGEGKWFCFSSINKQEVEAFIIGARAVITLMSYGFSHAAFRKNEYIKIKGKHSLSNVKITQKPMSEFRKNQWLNKKKKSAANAGI